MDLLIHDGDEQAATTRLLKQLSNGRFGLLEQVPVQLFHAPIGRHSEQQGITQHWTLALAAALARGKDADLSALNRSFLLAGEGLSTADQQRVASRFLPAPDAVRLLIQAANKAFDRGRFADYLNVRRLLLIAGNRALDNGAGAKRTTYARDSLLAKPGVDGWGAIPAPGPVSEPLPAIQEGTQQGLTIRWQLNQHHLLALGAHNQILWQRAIDTRSQVWFGARGALVLDPRGLHLIDESGFATDLFLPGTVTVLGLRGGYAWFYDQSTIHRYNLQTKAIHQIQLDDKPTGLPVVRGTQHLWLTHTELVLVDDDRIVARWLHLLPVQAGWGLRHNRHAIQLIQPDGRGRAITPLQQVNDPVTWMHHLNRASRFAESLSFWQQLPEAQQHRGGNQLAAALVGLGNSSGLRWAEIQQYIANERLRLAVALRLQETDPAVLAKLAAAAPFAAIGLDPNNKPLHPQNYWRHLITGTAISQHLTGDKWIRTPATALHALTKAKSPVTAPITVAQRPPLYTKRTVPKKGTVFELGDMAIDIQLSEHDTSVFARSKLHGKTIWRHSWASPDFLPGRAMSLQNGRLLIAEGQSRISVLDPNTGERLYYHRLANGLAMPSQIRLRNNTGENFAILQPLGVGTTLTLLDGARQRDIELPGPSQWMLSLGDQVLVAGWDGVLRRYPGGETISWPGALPDKEPSIHPDGLMHGNTLWPWIK